VSANAVTLDARLASRDDLRFTAVGLPALDFQLAHESVQIEADRERRVACELAAVALGPVARDLASVALGAQLRCRGFLARRYRTGSSVALHVNEFELLEGN
jgi:primosomal replication protein N